MKLLVVGATHGVGKQVVDLALDQGHEVHAFARGALDRAHERLTAFTGDATQPGNLTDAIAGVDAVICAIGGGLSDRTTRTTATAQLVRAMADRGVCRLVVISSLGAGDSYPRVGFATKAIVRTLLRNAIHDHNAQEAIVRASDLDWVLLRPAALGDGPQAPYRAIADRHEPLHSRGRLPRHAVAQAALRALEEPGWTHRAVALLPA